MRKPPMDVLRAFGLERQRLQPASPDGRVWLTDAAVLKRRRLPGPAVGLRWEAELRAAAARAGWPAARVVPTGDGAPAVEFEGWCWTCEGRLPGEPRELVTVAAWRIAGRLLGRLHRDLAAADPGEQRPGLGKVWELDLVTGAAGAGTFNQLVTALGEEYPELAAAVRRERYRNLRELARLGYPELPEQPVHGDFSAKNLLWANGELSGLVDWEFSRRDAALCDLAPLLMPFEPLEPQFARALFEGYAAVRPVSNQEFGLLPALVRASLLWWVAAELVRWRLEGGPPASIAQTMQVRFPAFERYALGLGFLRENVRG